jgi:murein DD-endopeptidase MepM/ murein hydrolase activator NlpD
VAKRRRKPVRKAWRGITTRTDAARKLAILHQYWRRYCLRAGRSVLGKVEHPGSPTGTIWPVAGVVTSLFGQRPDPIRGDGQFHSGIDIYTPVGTPVKAVLKGRVKAARYMRKYGKTVIISHRKSLETLYAHNSRLCVRRGQKVRRGQIIGYSGASGRVTGPHVHYEVRVDGESVDPLEHLGKSKRAVLAEVIDML